MDIIQKALSYNFIIFGGYIRDTIICKQKHFRDIDVMCPWKDSHKIPLFLRDISPLKIKSDTLEKTGRTRHRVYPHIRRIINLETQNNLQIDIIVFEDYESFLGETVDMTCNTFFMTRDGVFYRGGVDYSEMTRGMKFRVIGNVEESKRIEMKSRGWTELK